MEDCNNRDTFFETHMTSPENRPETEPVIMLRRGNFFFCGETAQIGPKPFLGGFYATLNYRNTHTHISGRILLYDGSSRRRNKTHTSMFLAGFEPAVPASERLQTHALDCATTGISKN